MEKIVAFLLIVVISLSSFSQTDSVELAKKQTFIKSLIVPISITTVGLLLNNKSVKASIQNKLLAHVKDSFSSSIDEFTPYVPVVQMYLADIAGLKAKNNFMGQSKNLFFSQLGTAIIVLSFKKSLNYKRPNGKDESFPSGHTSRAFVSSQVLYQEFKESNKLIAYSGYLFASTTAGLRVYNNKHWVPDVLVGAAIGMAVTNLVYYVNPLSSWKMFEKKNETPKLSFIPTINFNNYGFLASYKF